MRFDFTPETTGLSCPLVFRDPVAVITTTQISEVLPALLDVQRAVTQGLYAAGFVAYEAAPAFDAAMSVPPPAASSLPLVWFGLYLTPDPFTLISNRDAKSQWDFDSPGGERQAGRGYTLSAWEPAIEEAQYADDIAQIRAGIGRGEFYQVNHTMRLRARFAGDACAWYEQLKAAQRAAYCADLDLGRYRILSVSPELFFRRQGDRVVTRPMKGTAPRGRWYEEDQERAQALSASEKDRAENIMIVDLLRNDLGRIALTGSVRAEPLFAVERYPTLFQMTSTVSASVAPETTLADLFTALFPCGSVTGAPKISAMRCIAALEREPRQIYCGAVGLLIPNGSTVFSVAIRTVLLDNETGIAEYGVGSGITWDSTAAGEYAESLIKAAVLNTTWPDFQLLETLRLENGEYALLDRHVRRICASADYFGYSLILQAVREALLVYAAGLDARAWRVRLLAARSGALHIEHAPLSPPASLPLRVMLAATPVGRQDRFLYHKTTYRATYETRRVEWPEMDETLLWNEEGELTEFTTGNLVIELDEQLWTPPLDCGLLPGTLRAELLERGEVVERVLHPAELASATDIWLINSVRGWLPVRLVH